MVWYCAFCGRYHTRAIKAYRFPYTRQKSGVMRTDKKDCLCKKGLLFVELLRL